jgi:hypothetical protein
MPRVGLRWTIGDVSRWGFEALQMSVRSACALFGDQAEYAVCVNSIPVSKARVQTGPLPRCVRWLDAGGRVPAWLAGHLAPNMAEGVAWKFAPVRLFPESFEIALDNDVILWRLPRAMREWLEAGDGCLLAADVQRCLGQFSERCNAGAINSGIRGVPPGFDLEGALRSCLDGVVLRSELDEQGLQAAALSRGKLYIVSSQDVSICSPFPAHQHRLGECGVHFVGLNAKHMPWTLNSRWAHEVIHEEFARLRPAVEYLCRFDREGVEV